MTNFENDEMKTVVVIFVLSALLYAVQSHPNSQYRPTTRPRNHSSHGNFNLLPTRGACGIQSLQDKVFGGSNTGLDEFPWMALLEYQKQGYNTGFQCGGSLINERYVVTAAHCIVGNIQVYFGNIVRVRFGEYDTSTSRDCIIYDEGDDDKTEVCSDPPQDIEVEKVIAHPSYNDFGDNKYHDIGLVRLKKKVILSSFVKPICLPLNGERTLPGELLTVAGWGKINNVSRSAIKQKAPLPVIANNKCTRVYSANVEISDTQICAGGQKGIDSCNGDSGGPLMCSFTNKTEFYLEGIVSFGLTGCGTQGVPGVYTRVTEYVDWILNNMKPF